MNRVKLSGQRLFKLCLNVTQLCLGMHVYPFLGHVVSCVCRFTCMSVCVSRSHSLNM